MSISKQARTLVAALAIGAAILSLPVGQADAFVNAPDPHAEVKPKGKKDVYCVITLEDGTLDFYLPGQSVWDELTGRGKTCGADGKWHREGETETPVGPGAPGSGGGGVLGR